MISELCVWDLARDAADVVLRHESVEDDRIEAPNWLGDDDFLVNGSGLLLRARGGALHPVDTGRHTGCNNDHGLSPDGRWIAFSDKVETGQSCIYVISWDGMKTIGPARRVTADVPSWFHGWSPDGQNIVYVGARGDRIVKPFVCDAATGAERLLADGFDHVDGPDMSPDGADVWFNGEKDGAVDLWRVPFKGGAARRMTDGDSVDWFPHPSPCGRHIAFIAYPAGTKGHPWGIGVGLCLMDAGGANRRELARIWGGQGCLNVPSWAPDGHAFAFMRYVP